ncbi:MAG: response regulator [Acidobacteriota bacterium]|nr:response regulator [Acidobacteriota bacterium]
MAQDPYRYFRIEAAELHERLSQGLLDLEDDPQPEPVAGLLRTAHTLKGAARVVSLDDAARLAHALEDQLAAWRDARAASDSTNPSKISLQPLFRTVDEIGAELQRVLAPAEGASGASAGGSGASVAPGSASDPRPGEADGPGADAGGAAPGVGEDSAPSVAAPAPAPVASSPLDLLGLEDLMHRTLAITGRVARSQRALEDLRRHSAPGAEEDPVAVVADELEAVVASLGEIRDGVEELSLVAAAELLNSLRRAARDIAQAQGKQITVRLVGREARFDAELASALRDILIHAVTNAVTHGVTTEDRGHLTLSCQREGGLVVFRVIDDGPGINAAALLSSARSQGALAADEGDDWELEEIAQLAFQPGVTTASGVDHLAGRGIGLDALRQRVEGLQGEVRLLPGDPAGSVLEIRTPFSSYAVPALYARACGRRFALPLHAVAEVRPLPLRAATGDELLVDDVPIPLGAPRRALHLDVPTGEYRVAVVLRHGMRQAALGVDRVEEVEELAVLPLPPWTAPAPAVAGIGRGRSGEPIPMLSVEHLITAIASSPGLDERVVIRRPLPVLVVDDSLTSRMLQQSILEAAGYRVETASSPAQGLLRMAKRPFGLLLVDVEMPGMDGFTFVTRTRAHEDPVPAILISSRNSPEDRRRGLEAGASHYVVKGEFDQEQFLKLVEELILCR